MACQSNSNSPRRGNGFVTVIVLYILLAIILSGGIY